MPRTTFSALVVLVSVLLGAYQLVVRPLLDGWGVGRVLEPRGNNDCIAVPELKACEKIVLHQPTGVLYLACSTPESRVHWTPAVLRLNASGRSPDDYIATYNPHTSRITKFLISGFNARGLSLHGMDVVPSAANASELWVYLINHRLPLEGDANVVGADSSIEVFKTAVGSDTLTYVRTFEHPVIITPNDVVGSADGQSVYFTNDYSVKTGNIKRIITFLGRADTSVGYCHASSGCKIAIANMHGNNGITRSRTNDTFYVANSMRGQLRVLERQSDDTLVLVDVILTDRGIDNVSVDEAGNVWAAGLVNVFTLVHKHFADPLNHNCPSSALRFSRNTGPSFFYGEKYKVEKLFEDDGALASGITSAVYDSQRNRLFLHGLCSPHLVVCRL